VIALHRWTMRLVLIAAGAVAARDWLTLMTALK
jgi:hypothetical protein